MQQLLSSSPEGNGNRSTQKPEQLIAKIILSSSAKGDYIFDPFLGYGTTSVVAKKLGRKYLGIEAEDRFCIWTDERLDMADNNKNIQGYSDGVFYERNTIPPRQSEE